MQYAPYIQLKPKGFWGGLFQSRGRLSRCGEGFALEMEGHKTRQINTEEAVKIMTAYGISSTEQYHLLNNIERPLTGALTIMHSAFDAPLCLNCGAPTDGPGDDCGTDNHPGV